MRRELKYSGFQGELRRVALAPNYVTADKSSMDSKTLRNAIGQFASGVTVLTTRTAGGVDHGMTANAFSSVSLEPPLLLVCVDKKAHAHDFISQAGCFVVNVLAASQEDVSDRFAHRVKTADGYKPWPDNVDKFSALATTRAASGCAALTGALVSFDCSVHAAFDGGDHTIYVGKVEAVVNRLADGESNPGPLLFFGGRYKTFA